MSGSLVIRIPGEIRGKGRPRFSRAGGFVRAYSDAKTANAETWIKACAIEQVGQPVLEGPLVLTMAVTCIVPTSWSKRRRADALVGTIRPTGKPDLDNTVKLLADAFNGVVWRDDSQLVDVHVTKRYGVEPGAVVTVTPA